MIRLDDLCIDNYKIYQDDELYNFSTDAVLLANFIEFKRNDVVMDFCSGNGVVGILGAIKNNYKKIYLVEIQQKLACLAQKSVELNKLENVEVLCEDIKNLKENFLGGSIDVITCNPPYRKCDGQKQNENEEIKICNFEVKITLEEIIKTASYLLKFGGKLFMINSVDRMEETICLLNEYKFKTKILQLCNPKANKNANVFLIMAVKNAKSGIKVLPNLILNDDNGNFLVKIKKGKNER
ncbi:MAG: tRNA1(Val) (adenine(37)-N6)-methyltransferase [Christensenellales bacterium]